MHERMELAASLVFDPRRGEALYAGSGPERPYQVVIDVDSSHARLASGHTWNDSQTVQEKHDGSVRITFKCDDFAPVIAWALRFGAHAVVRKPPALVALVREQLEATAARYRMRTR